MSTRKRDVKDGKAEDATRQPEQVRAFRDTWKLGIHSYLAYLRDRLVVARELLTETGSVFVQIGDENVHLVRCVLDEVFGSENFCVADHVRKDEQAATAARLACQRTADYILWYAKNREHVKYRQLYVEKSRTAKAAIDYDRVELPDGTERRLTTRRDGRSRSQLPREPGAIGSTISHRQRVREATVYQLSFKGETYRPGQRRLEDEPARACEQLACGRSTCIAAANAFDYVRYLRRLSRHRRSTIFGTTRQLADSQTTRSTSFKRNTKVIERCLLMTTDPGDLVLDPTCGSGTTAYVAEQWGRRWITSDTSRVALALARTRLMAAKYPYYLLADSPEGIKKEAELTGKTPPDYKTEGDIKKGFVYKRVPHVTLKSIANNPDIREGMTRERDRRRHRPPRRDRDALRPALRGQQARAGVRAVLGREPVAAPRAVHRRREPRRHGDRAGGAQTSRTSPP